jgi:hypothetical protein
MYDPPTRCRLALGLQGSYAAVMLVSFYLNGVGDVPVMVSSMTLQALPPARFGGNQVALLRVMSAVAPLLALTWTGADLAGRERWRRGCGVSMASVAGVAASRWVTLRTLREDRPMTRRWGFHVSERISAAQTANVGGATVRFLLDFRVPTYFCRPTVTAWRCSSMRRPRLEASFLGSDSDECGW